jgi:murein DD-endopeptidase MepM/ murein hydrolase activator NlpD
VLCLGAGLALLTGWSVAAAGYVLFHDTVVTELRSDARASAKGYQSQIAALQAELERTRTRRMVERTGVDERLAELARRQQALDRRHGVLTELAAARTPLSAELTPSTALTYSAKPSPVDQPTSAFDALDPASGRPLDGVGGASTEKLSSALDRMEASQSDALNALAAQSADRRRKLERVYDAAGVRKPALGDGRGRGGPFEPLPARASFEIRAQQVALERSVVVALDRGLERVPVRTPATAGSSVSSGFGSRLDPFLGRPAFHAGIDFESASGQPVRSTAAGRVVTAGWSGGYGNMVEIDHGGGLSTRFGHLSSISVVAGQAVGVGAIVGRVGSTGRSTGPHLHYETRVEGEAVDPLRFLRAGQTLARID